MTNKYASTILVTGGTLGLGYEAALALAKQFPNFQIIIASRTDKNSAATKINNTLHQSNTIFLPLDLSSPDNITTFASTLTTTYPPISHLILNAGLQFPKTLEFFPNKIEKTFQVNHLGHAQLFYLLLPHLTPEAHILLIGSGTHDPAIKSGFPEATYSTAEELAYPNPQTAHPDGRQRYGTSKLVNIMWTYALHRHAQAAGKKWQVNVFDPGLMPGTGLARNYPAPLRFIWLYIWPHMLPLLRWGMGESNIHTARESGRSLARLAVGEEQGVKGESGKYWEGRKVIRSSVLSYDEAKQEDLWSWTIAHLAGGDDGVKRRWETLQG